MFEYLENTKEVRHVERLESDRLEADPVSFLPAVHSWNQDGLRWLEEGQGQERPHHVPQERDCLSGHSKTFGYSLIYYLTTPTTRTALSVAPHPSSVALFWLALDSTALCGTIHMMNKPMRLLRLSV